MAVNAEDLAMYVGLDLVSLQDDGDYSVEMTKVVSAYGAAVLEVDTALSGAWRAVPASVRDRLVLEVGHAYYKRSDSPSGSSQGVDFSTGQPVLGPRDPMAQVWPIVRRYVLPF